MNESNYRQHRNERPERASVGHDVPHDTRPYWKRAHHDWRFWIGLFFMFVAITIYVLSENLAFIPHP